MRSMASVRLRSEVVLSSPLDAEDSVRSDERRAQAGVDRVDGGTEQRGRGRCLRFFDGERFSQRPQPRRHIEVDHGDPLRHVLDDVQAFGRVG